MYLSSSICRGAAAALLMSVTALGQDSDTSSKPVPPPPAPAPGGEVQAEETAEADGSKTSKDPFAQKDQDAGDKNAKPNKGKLTFPAGGFTGKGLRIQPPPMQENEQAQDANAAQQGQGFNNNRFNNNAMGPVASQPPVYLPNYNQNRPYGYPYYNYGYTYPGYFYPGYGYGYGYGIGHGVLKPGFGGSATGGSNFFGNPHGSQYFGNPHASQGR